MSVDSVKVFENTLFTKISVVLIFGVMLLWGGFVILNPKYDLFVMGFFYMFVVGAVILACIVFWTRKIIVTSDAVISKNFFEEQVIPFKTIQRMKVGSRGKTIVLNIFTDQSTIALNYGAQKKELHVLKAYIRGQILENDPEHFNQVIVPQNEPESFLYR